MMNAIKESIREELTPSYWLAKKSVTSYGKTGMIFFFFFLGEETIWNQKNEHKSDR